MPNFYKDNEDLIFHLKNADLDKIITLKENDFAEKDLYKYAPKNIKDAKDSYERILEIVGDICANIIEPNAASVDEEGAHFENGEVIYAKGTQENLDACRKADLMGLTVPRKYGGLNVPLTIYTMVIEMISRADASFMNIFGLQSDIANTINKFADEEVKNKYLPKLCLENVTSSMILTEPDAGSDLQSVMLKAYQDNNGKWFLKGVKRFITNGCGEIALVLARSEEGTTDGRGLSMFLYERDDKMKIRRIENKLGIHGSPTCELQFNDAPAILIGKRKMGLIKYVMSLMNEARVGVSAQALGIAEAAYREAKKYANERIQFKVPIKDLIPVAEMLVSMKVKIEAARSLLYETTRLVDLRDSCEEYLEKNPDKKELREELKLYETLAAFFTPMCKAYTTEIANQVAYDALQIHGGTGYMKEFNIERHFRDARITNIYEGTTQLQIVAAIGGLMKGAVNSIINIYEKKDYSIFEFYHKKIKEMYSYLEKAIAFVKEKNDPDYQTYHSRRLVEMATKVIIGYLFLQQSFLSERKQDVLKYYLETTLYEVKSNYEFITSNTTAFLEKKHSILNYKN